VSASGSEWGVRYFHEEHAMTRRCFATLAALALAAAAADKPDDAAKDEMKKLEGTWAVVSVEAMGKAADKEKDPVPQQVVFKDDKITLKMRDGDGPTFVFAVDPGQKPKAMNWIKEADGSHIGGIYSLDGDELKLCFPLVPKERKEGETLKRPENFDTKDKPVMLLTAKREKK
jgi:uncharacterized protein (TIGR03067 family)